MVNTNSKKQGVWFYGLSGSGKSRASEILSHKITKSFLIDGDDVRRYVSFDLGYSVHDRQIQLKRLFGIAKLALDNGTFPLISSVLMTSSVFQRCNELSIEVIEIIRPMSQLEIVRDLYRSESNVVGIDIEIEHLPTLKIPNNGTETFDTEIVDYAKRQKLF